MLADRLPTFVVVPHPAGLLMLKDGVGDVGQLVPEATHVAKKAGSPADGTLSVPASHVIVADELVALGVGTAPATIGVPGGTAQPVDCAELDVNIVE